jgi:hypothetical protein
MYGPNSVYFDARPGGMLHEKRLRDLVGMNAAVRFHANQLRQPKSDDKAQREKAWAVRQEDR